VSQTGRPPALVMVSGYSRMITAVMLPSRMTGDLIDGHWQLLKGWKAVPKMLVWDNESGIGQGKLTTEFAAFAGMLAVKVFLCRARDPEAKGLVERANGYLETRFLPGRTFTGPDDFNTRSPTGWPSPTGASTAAGAPALPSGGKPTGPARSHCRRSIRPAGSASTPASAATTTSASTPATTPYTRWPSANASTSPPARARSSWPPPAPPGPGSPCTGTAGDAATRHKPASATTANKTTHRDNTGCST
jgi:hypothetical protein